MTIEVKHKFVSLKADGPDATRIRPSNWNDTHEILMATNRILGRTTAAAGAVEEIPLASTLEFNAGSIGVAAATIARITSLENTDVTRRLAVPIADSDNSHTVSMKIGSNMTADRDLTILMDDANTTLNIPALVAGSPAMVYLGAVNAAAAANVDFTGLSASYDEFVIALQDVYQGTSSILSMVVSTDNGASWLSSNYGYATLVGGSTPSGGGNAATSNFALFTNTPNANGNGMFGEVRIFTGETDACGVNAIIGHRNTAGIKLCAGSVALSGTKVNAVRFTNNTISGNFKLFGVKNS